MLVLDTSGDWLEVLLIAVPCGAFAGFVSELLLPRMKAGETGAVERIGGRGTRFYDLGSWAAVLVGALAGPVAAYLLAPGPEVVIKGQSTQTAQVGDVVVIAALAGLAGSRFLGAIQERFLAFADKTRVDAALKGLRDVKETAENARPTPPPPKPDGTGARPSHPEQEPDHPGAKPPHAGHEPDHSGAKPPHPKREPGHAHAGHLDRQRRHLAAHHQLVQTLSLAREETPRQLISALRSSNAVDERAGVIQLPSSGEDPIPILELVEADLQPGLDALDDVHAIGEEAGSERVAEVVSAKVDTLLAALQEDE